MQIKMVFFLGLVVIIIFNINAALAEVSFGNPKGSIVLVEYFDYNCPVCRRYLPMIDALAHANPEIKVVQRVVPVLDRNSQLIDRAVLSAYFQGKFNQMQQAILQVQDRETIPPQDLLMIVKGLKLNIQVLVQDMNSDRVKQQLIMNLKAFEATHQNRVPIIEMYNIRHPDHKIKWVGTHSYLALQHLIDSLKYVPINSIHYKENVNEKYL